jgi:hypothetical protein
MRREGEKLAIPSRSLMDVDGEESMNEASEREGKKQMKR